MNRKFEILFSINLTHSYYKDGICRDFVLEPTGECVQALSRYRLLFRKKADGCLVIFELDESSTNNNLIPKFPVSVNEKFTFTLKLQNPYFSNFTKLGGLQISKEKPFISFYSFQNDDALKSKTGILLPYIFNYTFKANDTTLQLKVLDEANNVISDKTINRQPGQLTYQLDFTGYAPGWYKVQELVANVLQQEQEVYLDSNLKGKNIFGLAAIILPNTFNYSEKKAYKINFPATSSKWNYYVVTGSTDTADYSIEDKGSPNPDKIVFSAVANPSTPTLDTIKAPEKKVLLFTSDAEVAWKEQPRAKLNLLKGNNPNKDKVIENLPNPSVSNVKTEMIINL